MAIKRLHVRVWLQGDIQPPEIDFRLTPNNGHSEGYAGLPVLTHSGSGQALPFSAYTGHRHQRRLPYQAGSLSKRVRCWLGTPILGKAERVRSAPMSDIDLLGNRERIVNLDTKVSDSALDLRVSQQ